MKPEGDMELEGRQESEIRQKEGGGEVGDDASNRVSSKEDQAALFQRLLEENALLKQENTELKQENTELDANASVKELLETFHGIPPMKENKSATPSLDGKPSANGTRERKQPRRSAAVEASKKIAKIAIDDEEDKQEQHAPADIQSMEKQVLGFMKKFPLNLKDGNGKLVKSMIALSMGKSSTNKEAKLTNFNEASVSLHVIHLLHDVLQCLHLSSTVDIGQEISIFSMRPDVVVVRWQASIILVIEVKNPGKDGRLVVNDNRAAGQVYDYSMGLYQMGIEHPFVCLSTYDYMRIGTLVASTGDIFSKALEKLKNGTIRDVDSEPYKPQKEPTSPEKKGNLTMIPDDSKWTQLEDEEDIGESGPGEQPKRVIHFSEIFDRTNMFKALCFAVVCGLVAAEESTNGGGNETLVPEEGAQIDKCVAVVTKDSFHWEYLKSTVTYQLKMKWQNNMKVFLHCVLGQGCSGKVFLASDSSGRMFAVKLYLFDSKIMESFRGDSNEEEKKNQKEVAMEIRDIEAQKWKRFYPSFKKAIFPYELFGVPCLAMPYVALIPTKRRTSLLPKIEKELKRFADKGLAYWSSDLRWRHIGLRMDKEGKEQIILVDLESMQEVEEGEEESIKNAHAAINAAIVDLKKRADEAIGTPQGFIHA